MPNTIKRIVDCKCEEYYFNFHGEPLLVNPNAASVLCLFINGEQFYLVKWNLSWEPAKNLEPLYKSSVDDFWNYINTCKNAIDGKPTPAKKRKIDQVYSQVPPVSPATPVTPTQERFDSLPTTPTSHHQQQQQMKLAQPNLQNHIYQQQPPIPASPTQNQVQPQPQIQQQFQQVSNSPDTKSPGRGRGSGRGRGRGKGGRGGRIKQEQDSNTEFNGQNTQLQMSTISQHFGASHDFQHVLNSPNAKSPSRGRGSGRGRGKGRGGKIKQEQDCNMEFNGQNTQLPLSILSQPFGMSQLPISQMSQPFGASPDLNKDMPAFNFDNVQNPMGFSSVQNDVKPVISPDGQVMSPMMAQQAMNAAMSGLSPTKPKCSSAQSSPSSRGRSRGKGHGMNHSGTTIKEENPNVEPMSARATNENSINKNAPNPSSGDNQYENFSNPYANLVLVCRQCSREQNPKNRSSWKSHFESHLDIKNFGCYHCPKRFRMKGDLKTHITRVHKEEFVDEMVVRFDDVAEVPAVDPSDTIDGWTNPYVRNVFQCKVCQRELQWKSRSAWKSHYESHLDIKRFGCYVCGKQFRMKGDLKTHITRVHKVEFEDYRVIKLDVPEDKQA